MANNYFAPGFAWFFIIFFILMALALPFKLVYKRLKKSKTSDDDFKKLKEEDSDEGEVEYDSDGEIKKVHVFDPFTEENI